MLDGVADGHTERKQDDLGDGEECSTEDDITDGPAVLKSPEYENQLRHDIDDRTDEWPEDIDDPEPDRFGVGEAGETLERGNRDEEAYAKYDQASYPEELWSRPDETRG